jgi:hypothetical protein
MFLCWIFMFLPLSIGSLMSRSFSPRRVIDLDGGEDNYFEELALNFFAHSHPGIVEKMVTAHFNA